MIQIQIGWGNFNYFGNFVLFFINGTISDYICHTIIKDRGKLLNKSRRKLNFSVIKFSKNKQIEKDCLHILQHSD